MRQLYLVLAKNCYIRQSNKDCPTLGNGEETAATPFFTAVLPSLPVCLIQNEHLYTGQMEGGAVVEMIN